ncbi:DUF445 domain-containing protein [Allostreptomyces psammosilenae]|uniref:Uncharacterized membrane-anchored protein YjiN (DUF445 family) n=1 Tax=Allostreptomyces psammosilenae TaxID=1892865 RepID=A0A853A0M4_9ACTN|nr:uncharacterized membrane-anchored protein YjiN (DUF445 family) [Allostreptomyces psammosilenae]
MRRMKLVATGFLAVATVVFVLARWAEASGAGPWAGYVQAAAEAGMVGALADWFAVTALFRRPLGLPIPHTAIIPTRKDAIGTSLADFVGDNFLSEEVIRRRLSGMGIGARLGGWLAEPANAERTTAELSTAVRGVLRVLRDEDVQTVIARAVTQRAARTQVSQPLGELLDRVVADGGHRGLVDLVCNQAHDWLVKHRDAVIDAVGSGAPGWTPRFVDERIGAAVHRELLRFVTDVRDDRQHAARGAVDRFLRDFANDLRNDPDTMMRTERLKIEALSRPELQQIVASAWRGLREMIESAAEEPESELRARLRDAVRGLGRRLAEDPRLQGKVDAWLEDAAAYLVSTYRGEITSLITDTVASWDAEDTSRKIETQVGRDLQFIRINGTVVGALAGLVIYTLSHL